MNLQLIFLMKFRKIVRFFSKEIHVYQSNQVISSHSLSRFQSNDTYVLVHCKMQFSAAENGSSFPVIKIGTCST